MELSERIPYFDALLEQFERGNQSLIDSFGTHVHWGYWPDPTQALQRPDDFNLAADRLSFEIFKDGFLRDGQSVADVGCGFGGTIDLINRHYSRMTIVGINIDERQIQRARNKVQAQPGNRVEFLVAEASKLPLDDASCDVVVALECIFHFDSRDAFFGEVRRVLKPGGRLVISDFLFSRMAAPLYRASERLMSGRLQNFWGVTHITELDEYRRLALKHQLPLDNLRNITANAAPTMAYMRKTFRDTPELRILIALSSAWFSVVAKTGILNYYILSFQRPG